MERKPDILRAIVLVFAVGLVITGITSLQASEEKQGANARAVANDVVLVPVSRGDHREPTR
ncbi:hypothetical protein EHN06_17665 [Marinobacter sp. NP-4(2019)]|uniref:hypothetical protein n=1 Tax=Marinobacter sp. NP-4(2019) TaxID=2488665 RepID=UPI000FC3E771|nr:hypothetical protein [Marinobacter sp. NP-4(2019)]AZT85231.1 hypothetical protein EHN06_17665 [Marinobacter sp. NP-4(2019)]